MPSTSIYLDEDIIERIDSQLDQDESRSQWIQEAIRKELDKDHDDLEELEQRVRDLEEWKLDTMDDIVSWFSSEFGPSQ